MAGNNFQSYCEKQPSYPSYLWDDFVEGLYTPFSSTCQRNSFDGERLAQSRLYTGPIHWRSIQPKAGQLAILALGVYDCSFVLLKINKDFELLTFHGYKKIISTKIRRIKLTPVIKDEG